MEKFSMESRIRKGQGKCLVYFCSFDSNRNYFTLLETKKVRRKDSSLRLDGQRKYY